MLRCFCLRHVVVVVVGILSSLLASRLRCRSLFVVVVIGFSFSLLASHSLCRRLVLIVGLFTTAAVFLLMADFFGFATSSLLFFSEFRRCHWRCVVVVGGGVPFLGFFCWLRCIVTGLGVVRVSLLSLFRHCRQWRPFLWLRPSASAPRCRCRRSVSFIVGGVLLLFSSSASRCWCFHRLVSYCWRRIIVIVVVGLPSSFLAAAYCRFWQRRRRGIL